jgi:Spy/CpxP family protein refolding chaperone
MVRSSRRLLVTVLSLGASLGAVAQDNPAPGAPPGGGPGFGRGGGMMIGRLLGGSLDDLQKELNLTPEQRTKIEGVLQEGQETIRQRMEAARTSGDWQSIRGEFEKVFADGTEKVKATLTPEQQEKFTKYVESARGRMEAFGRGGDRGRGSPEQRVTRAMESLKIADAAEADAIKALIAKIVKLQDDARTHERTAQDKASELLKSDGMADDALEARIKDLRAQRKAVDDQLLQAQEELQKVVTIRQEVELFRQGIIR